MEKTMKLLINKIYVNSGNFSQGKTFFFVLTFTSILLLSLLTFAFSSNSNYHAGLFQEEADKETYVKTLISERASLTGNQNIHLNIVDTKLLYVEFYIDGEMVFKDEEPPWECTYNFGEKPKEHEVRVLGYYSREVKSKSLTIEPEKETSEAPEEEEEEAKQEKLKVTITSPEANTYVSGIVTIKADVSPPPGVEIERVEFYVDKILLFTDKEAPYEYEWDAGKEFNRRVIEVVAYDNKGGRASDAILTKDLEGYVFEAKVDLVTMDVTVTDKYGKYMAGLEQKDFTVYEDGKPQQVSYFTKMERPLTVGILIDTSGSMQYGKLKRAQTGAKKFVSTLKEVDKAFIMSFSDEVEVEQNFTNAIGALNRAIDELEPAGSTALNKAIYDAIEKLKEEKGRKAIVVLSDGYDTVGKIDEEQVLEAAKKADVKIYSIGIFESRFEPPSPMRVPGGTMRDRNLGERILKVFSDWTGGEAYFPSSLGELDEIYARIAEELRRQYSLGYYPNNKARDGKWRKIEVKLKKKDLHARTKKGYYAPKGA
jgi:Ca-activated chloride channel family protein